MATKLESMHASIDDIAKVVSLTEQNSVNTSDNARDGRVLVASMKRLLRSNS